MKKSFIKDRMKELLLVKFDILSGKDYMVNKKNQSAVLIISTFPNEESIASISKDLIVSKKLCACISLTKVRSMYYWNDKLEDQEEFIVFFKTTKLCANRLKDEVKKLHPYEVPEILEIKVDDVSGNYLSWLVQSTTMPTHTNRPKSYCYLPSRTQMDSIAQQRDDST